MNMDPIINKQPIHNNFDSVTDKNSESFILLLIFRNIIKKLWLFLFIALAGGVSGYLYAIKQKPVNSTKHVPDNEDRRLYLRIERGDDQGVLLSLKDIIDTSKGDVEVVLVLGDESNKQIIRLPSRVQAKPDILELFKDLIGATNVKLH